MNGKWASLVLATVIVGLPAVAAGCRRSPEPIVEVPPPAPRNEAGDSAATDATSQAETRSGASTTTADTTGTVTADDVARQVAELEAALARRKAATGDDGQVATTTRTNRTMSDDSQPTRVVPQKAGEVTLTNVQPVEVAGMVAAQTPTDDTTTDTSQPPEVAPVKAPPAEAATLDTLIERYEEMAARNPSDVEIARTLRMLHFAAGQDEKSLEAIAGLPPAEQKLWRDLMWTLIVARDRTPGTNRSTHAGEVLDALDAVRSDLATAAPMELGEVRFCTEVQRFGVYTPTTVNRFLPGESLLLYTEIRKFTSKQEGDGLYHVRLIERLTLENESGAVVWRHNFENIDDTCRTPRQDFFLGTTLPLPAKLPAGRYVLKVVVEDAATSRSAGARLELEITGQR